MIAFEIVAKVHIGKFEQKILFFSVKVIYLLYWKNNNLISDKSRF